MSSKVLDRHVFATNLYFSLSHACSQAILPLQIKVYMPVQYFSPPAYYLKRI